MNLKDAKYRNGMYTYEDAGEKENLKDLKDLKEELKDAGEDFEFSEEPEKEGKEEEKEKDNEDGETFEGYALRPELLRALSEKGFSHPTPVQQRVLSSDWQGRDLIVRARTGSGKTLAFLLPLLQDIETGERTPRLLILAPTRELAQQTAQEAEWLTRHLHLSVVSLVGGMEIVPQLKALHHGAAILVGTPGRVRDHIQRGSLKSDGIRCVVLDEGDLMLDMGFREELESILGAMPEEHRTWLFSATMPEEVRTLADRYLVSPLTLSLVEEGAQHEDILHRVYMIPSRRRLEGLVNILLWERPKRSLVFCHTKMESIETAQKLQDEGFGAAALQGDMTQNERNAVLASFRSGSIPCLVATNVAARGLDIEGVTHVIQLGLPDDRETFVHRSGRTGRAGNEGTNLILLSPTETGRFRDMLRATQMKVEWLDVPGLDRIHTAQREAAEQELLSAPLDENYKKCLSWAEDLLSRAEPGVLVAKLLAALGARTAKGYDLATDLERERERRRAGRAAGRRPSPGARVIKGQGTGHYAAPRSTPRPRGIMTRMRSSRGAQDAGRILNALCTVLKVERGEVGAIRFKSDHVMVELLPLALSRLEQSRAGLARWGLYPEDDPAGREGQDARSHGHGHGHGHKKTFRK